ncbi:DUF2946 family protein [Roseovarius dicentrarchi]|uniref:DUF2946 family protein n=1 Tax=Roseovarius dicentrarchi TaxID=2250573 RepID=UPI000DEB76FF|nr:DUF2946 family protein [Roseovarius dicentrarchi]
MMTTAFAHFCRLIIALCLVWYSPAAMAGSGNAGSAQMMEICANGAIQTIRVDGNGAPSAPDLECCDCTGCALVAADVPNPPETAQLRHTHILALDATPSVTSLTRTSNIRPMPRAPPVLRNSALNIYDMIPADHSVPGQGMHQDGRPLTKDAAA